MSCWQCGYCNFINDSERGRCATCNTEKTGPVIVGQYHIYKSGGIAWLISGEGEGIGITEEMLDKIFEDF